MMDTNRKLCNFFLYLQENKVKAAKQLLLDIGLRQIKFEVSKEKMRDKISNMIPLHRTWRNKEEETRQGLKITYHDQVIENI